MRADSERHHLGVACFSMAPTAPTAVVDGLAGDTNAVAELVFNRLYCRILSLNTVAHQTMRP